MHLTVDTRHFDAVLDTSRMHVNGACVAFGSGSQRVTPLRGTPLTFIPALLLQDLGTSSSAATSAARNSMIGSASVFLGCFQSSSRTSLGTSQPYWGCLQCEGLIPKLDGDRGGGVRVIHHRVLQGAITLLHFSKCSRPLIQSVKSTLSDLIRRDYDQGFAQPDLRAERKGALSGGFLLAFLCLRPKRAPKNLRQTLVTSDTLVSLEKVLPNLKSCKPVGSTPSSTPWVHGWVSVSSTHTGCHCQVCAELWPPPKQIEASDAYPNQGVGCMMGAYGMSFQRYMFGGQIVGNRASVKFLRCLGPSF